MTPNEVKHEFVALRAVINEVAAKLERLYHEIEPNLSREVICSRCKTIVENEGEFPDRLVNTCLMVGDQTVWLTPLEAEILDVLIANFGKVITYDRLIFNIFESGVPRIGAHKNEIDDPKATIQVSLVKLRRKMKVVPASIETRWGIGLVLTAEGDTDLKLEAA